MEVVVEFFSLDSGAVLERKTQTFGLKPRPEVDETHPRMSAERTDVIGSCSIDKGLHIKRKILGCSSYPYHVINCAYTLFIRLTVKLCMHLPLLYHWCLNKLRACVRSRHYKQPTPVVNDILYNAASVCEI